MASLRRLRWQQVIRQAHRGPRSLFQTLPLVTFSSLFLSRCHRAAARRPAEVPSVLTSLLLTRANPFHAADIKMSRVLAECHRLTRYRGIGSLPTRSSRAVFPEVVRYVPAKRIIPR